MGIIKNLLIILIAKISFFLIKFFSLGAGSTWPGHLALTLNNGFIKEILSESKLKIILVIGTNGKTTTASLLKFILEKNQYPVFQNEEGANLLNGIASSIIKNVNLMGEFSSQYAIWEVDENTFPLIMKKLTPEAVLILNLFRDQLDRYGEVNLIASKWFAALKKAPVSVKVFINGDDPQLYYIGTQLKQPVFFFGVDERLMKIKNIPHDVDFNYCPRCAGRLYYKKIAYSHLGEFFCSRCSFKRGKVETYSKEKIFYPLLGLYNAYNTNAAILMSENILGVSLDKIKRILPQFKPAFGRQEVIKYKKRLIHLILAKNPAGFNQSIVVAKRLSKDKKFNLLLLLNDRIPDGQDVSWIWDVDFEKLFSFAKKIFVSGDRGYDLGVRLKYAKEEKIKLKVLNNDYVCFNNIWIFARVNKALKMALSETEEDEPLLILATYTAMLEVRKIILGKKFL